MRKNFATLAIAGAIASVFVSQAAVADDQPATPNNHKELRILFGGGLTFGGDEIVDVTFTDGSSEELSAGGLFDLKAGVRYEPTDTPLIIQSTIGYHFDSVNATNGDAKFTRLPIDLLGFYATEKHLIGGGLSYHMNPEIEIDFGSIGMEGTAKLDDALGVVIEYGYRVSEKVTIAVRYLDISYEVNNEDFDGSHFGLYGYLHFGKRSSGQ